MAGVKAWRKPDGMPLIRPYFVTAGETYNWGDLVVLKDYTVADRVLLATNTELQSSTNGWLGFVWTPMSTDANGNLTQDIPSTVETGAAVIHPVPSASRIMHRASQALAGSTPDIGNHQIQICIFNDDLEVLMDVCSNSAATTVSQIIQGFDFGLIKDAGDSAYKVDVNNTTQNGAVIVEVDTTQSNFNASADNNNAVWIRIKQAYQQFQSGLLY